MLHHSSGEWACTNSLQSSDSDEEILSTLITMVRLDFHICLLNIEFVYQGAVHKRNLPRRT